MNQLCIPVDLVCEFLTNPLGIGEVKPRLSWKLSDNREGARQTAYQIVAGTNLNTLETKPDLWNSQWIKSDNQLDVEWGGKALKSKTKVFWKVKVKDLKGKESKWSEPATFELGLFKKSDWTASWISDGQIRPGPSPYFRKPFGLNEKPVSARLYITSRGLFEATLNGQKIGGDHFTPGWTEFSKRIHYLTYDVVDLLQQGDNVFGVVLGDGWFAGNLGWEKNRNIWGDNLSFIAELQITLSDGSEIKIISDQNWKYQYGTIRDSDIYHGETIDLRLTLHGWDKSNYDDNSWLGVQVVEPPKAEVLAKPGRPVRRQEELPAIELTEPKFGVHVFDLGQNMVGHARIKLIGQHYGDIVTIRYAEMLQSDGNIYTENLRRAKCTDTVYCDGNGEIWFEPKFTFHGFRYVELTGLRRKPELSDVTGVVLHSDIPSTGFFECSDPLVNKLQQNIIWGQKGNFFEAPTDCPQRDERLGWTGDAQIFIGTAAFNRDVATFFEKYCEDMEDAQFDDGRIPHVAPNPFRDDKGRSGGGGGQAAWADAVVICPWVTYLCYHDKRILERRYDSMQKFVEWRVKTSNNFIHKEALFGDWLAIDIPNENNCAGSPTPKDLISTAYFARTADILSQVSGILGKKAEEKKYANLFQNIKSAFTKEFVTPNGRVMGDTQCSYLLALGFNLLPKELIKPAGNNLVKALEKWKGHLATGFVGTPLLAPVLTSIGRVDLAYNLLLKQTYPSWLYTVLQGATTMWERWNSYTKDKGFGSASMNSFNHYAYGAIGEWMVSTVAGLRIDEKQPAYKHIIIKPELGEGISFAKAELQTRYGKASSSWKIENSQFSLSVDVPPNTTATVFLPGQSDSINCVAGHYEFSSKIKKEAKSSDLVKTESKMKNKPKKKTKSASKIKKDVQPV